MSSSKRGVIVLAVAALGLWGCAQGPVNTQANAERIRALETKIAKLEEDFKSAVAGREQLRKKLSSTEDERNQLSQQVEQLQIVVRERDDLRQQLAARTNERDLLQAQFNQFRKGIKSLLGQAELAVTTQAQPVTSAGPTPAAPKS